MNKTAWAAAAVAVAAIGYTGASWTLGQQIEQRYADEYGRALPMLGTDDVVSHEYERGWFTSVGRTVIEFEVPEELFGSQNESPETPAASEADAEARFRTVRLHLEDRVRHGPLPGWRIAAATVESRLTAIEGIDDAILQAFAGAKAPYLDTLFAFDGGFHGNLALPAGEVRQPALLAQWQQFDSTFDGTADSNRIKGGLNWPQFTVTPTAAAGAPAESVRVLMRGLNGDFEVEPPQDGQSWMSAQGSYKGRIDELSMRRAGDGADTQAPLLAYQDVQLDSRSTLDGALLNAQLNATSRGNLGALEIESLRLNTALDRLDTAALTSLQALLQPTSDPTAPDADEQTGMAVQQAIEQLLAARPAYAAKFSATLGGQDGELGYRLAAVDTAAQTPFAFPPGAPLNLLLLSLVG